MHQYYVFGIFHSVSVLKKNVSTFALCELDSGAVETLCVPRGLSWNIENSFVSSNHRKKGRRVTADYKVNPSLILNKND